MDEFLNSFSKLEFDKIKKYMQRYALSELGRERIDKLTPSTSLEEIRYQLTLVSEMKNVFESDELPPLDNVMDIRLGVQRTSIENFVLSSEELHSIALVLATGKNVTSFFLRRKNIYPLLAALIGPLHIDKILEYNINQTIDDEGRVKDSASKNLSSIRRQIVEMNDGLKKRMSSILKTLVDKEWAQDEIVTTREGRMVIPVKVEHKNQMAGFIHSSSSSGVTVFIEPAETLELNNEIRSLHFEEEQEIQKILKDLTQQVHKVKDDLLVLIRVLGEIDFIQIKTKYSIEIMGAAPIVKERGELSLKLARHPILLQKHKRDEVVPLNIEIGDDVNTLIITGPNAGGKSVVLKTVGLLSLLCQAGCHIPASEESEVRIFSDFFVDIGDEQSIENDLSSFSSHLNNMKFILEHATQQSLILIDEIGSGTDPNEGSSIAAAVLQRLSEKGCTTIVTTHHGALKTYAFETPHFQNGAMEFDITTLRPTYNFRSGVPGSSYAVEMAERIQLPPNVLDLAKNLRGSATNKLENLIIDLEHQSQILNKNLGEVQLEKERLNESINLYKNKISSLEKELKTIKSKALDEANLIVEKANTTIERVVREIKESSANQNVIKQAKNDIQQIDLELEKLRIELREHDQPSEFSVGDTVKLRNSGAAGIIDSKFEDNSYIVIIGDLKVRIKGKEIERMTAQVPIAQPHFPTDIHQAPQQKLDLRGMYGDEAISAIDKFFDDSILTGVYRVEIIHGKGSGSLRKRVSEYLKTLPSVKSFRLGEWNEGGDGVTIVELM